MFSLSKFVLILSTGLLLAPTAEAGIFRRGEGPIQRVRERFQQADHHSQQILPSGSTPTTQQSKVEKNAEPGPQKREQGRPIADTRYVEPADIFACVDGLKKAKVFPKTSELNLNGNRVLFIDDHFITKEGIFKLNTESISEEVYGLGIRDSFEVMISKNIGSAEVSGIDVQGNTRLVARALDQRDLPSRKLSVKPVKIPQSKLDNDSHELVGDLVQIFRGTLRRRVDNMVFPNPRPELLKEMARLGFPDKFDANLFAWLAPCGKIDILKDVIDQELRPRLDGLRKKNK